MTSGEILNVPRDDFNWQLWYDTSLKVQKGTKMGVLPSYGVVVVDDITLTQRDVVTRGNGDARQTSTQSRSN